MGYVNFLEGNIAPETLGLEDEFPFWEGYVARCYVGFGECSRFWGKKPCGIIRGGGCGHLR